MKVKAAVLREVNQPYTIEELELEPPRTGEALVRYSYCGYCHSDLTVLTGGMPVSMPLVPGHECSGLVEKVGPGVTRVKKGDHFVGTYAIPCGECYQCRRGRQNLCSANFRPFLEGTMLDGTNRFRDKHNKLVRHTCFLSGFSNYSVVPEAALIPIRKDLPLEQACLLGCCVPTGWGTVTNIANVKPGDSVAIYGMGGIGLNVLRAAALSHAKPVIAVDLEESKADIAFEFGATNFICNAKEDPVPKIQELTGGGVDFAFEAIGDPGAIVQAWWSTGVYGKVVVPGMTPFGVDTNLPLSLMALHQKSILGSAYGGICAPVDVPRLVEMAVEKDLMKLDKLITHKFKVEQLNDVADAMKKRQIIGRWICAWE